MTIHTPDEICEELAVIAARPSTSPLNRDMMLDAKATIERLSAEKAEADREIARLKEGLRSWRQKYVDATVSAALGKDASSVRSPGSSEGE